MPTKKVNYVVEMRQITKQFGNFFANKDINLQVKKNSIHALIGENGAGKTTLMSLLFGILQPTTGYIKINDKITKIKNPHHASSLGLGMVHQHFRLVEAFDTVENVILGNEPSRMGFVQKITARKKIESLIKKYNFEIDLSLKIQQMTVGMQQKVEILKLFYSNSQILIFDEPTAVLTPQEIKKFLILLKTFQKEGKTVIIITHKLEEVQQIANSVTILRRGEVVATLNPQKASSKEIVSLMIGNNITFSKNNFLKVPKKELRKVVCETKNVSLKKPASKKLALNNVSLKVYESEIVAIAGIEGNGQIELAKVIAGFLKVTSGHIYLNGSQITYDSIYQRYEKGLSHIPEDRQKHGLILDMSIVDNSSSKLFEKKPYSFFGLSKKKNLGFFAQKMLSTFQIKGFNNVYESAKILSGGNQQKLVAGREMSVLHNFLLAVQPTRGLDLGAIQHMHRNILREKSQGRGILLISYDLDEILALADRVLVIQEGKIVQNLKAKNLTYKKVGEFMLRKDFKNE